MFRQEQVVTTERGKGKIVDYLTMYLAVITAMAALAVILWQGAFSIARAGKEPALKRGSQVAGAFVAIAFTAAASLGALGVFAATQETRFSWLPLGILIPLGVALLLTRISPPFQALLHAVPQHWLIGIQVFRIFGLVFLILYARKELPQEFAVPAGVGDLLIGTTAPFVGLLCYYQHRHARTAALVWNFLGIGELMMAIGLGLGTSPGITQFLAQDTPNLLITAFPLVLLPTFAVPIFLFLHLVSLRRLLTYV
jgi:hypothetical protein